MYTILDVKNAMRETIGFAGMDGRSSTPWFLNPEVNDPINFGARQGWLQRPSTTQVQWTPAGAELLSSARKGDSR